MFSWVSFIYWIDYSCTINVCKSLQQTFTITRHYHAEGTHFIFLFRFNYNKRLLIVLILQINRN